MYAHLYFPANTSTGAQIRDITRLITSCATSTASLSGLEFITQGNSSVFGGNSGWTLNSNSRTLPTSGDAVATTTDSHFILQATTIGSKTKYCGIHANGNWTTSAVVTGDDYGFTLASVLDPGTATEMWSNGYTGTSSSTGDVHSICGNVEHSGFGIHVFADSTRIMIFGKDGNDHEVMLINAEFSETATTTYHTLVPQSQICINEYQQGVISESVSYRGDGNALWDDRSETYSFISFCDATFSNQTSFYGKIRWTGWHPSSGEKQKCARLASRINDGTQFGSSADEQTQFKGKDGHQHVFNYPDSISRLGSVASLFGSMAQDPYFDDLVDMDSTWGRSNAISYDSSGNPGLALHKVFWEQEKNWNNDICDFSTPCNFWRVAAGLGTTGDTVTIGSDSYVYIDMHSTAPYTLGAFLVKRT